MSYTSHKSHKISARCAIITTTDTRTLADDESGAFLEKALLAAGHQVVAHLIVPNDSSRIKAAALEALGICVRESRTDNRGESSEHRGNIPHASILIPHYSSLIPTTISSRESRIADSEIADVVIITGGTGISRRDITIETVAPMLTKQIQGFGELFRALSFQEIGSGAMLSRAIAGTIEEKIVFCTPGSIGAVKLAAERLIIPELSHLIYEATKQSGAGQEAKK